MQDSVRAGGKNMQPVIDRDKCIKCGKCAEICDGDVFYDSKKGEIPVIAYPGRMLA